MSQIRDTYHAALRHDHVEPAEEDLVVGVVRHPVYGIETLLDRNVPALAPPEALLGDFEAVEERDDRTHDEAWDEVNFAERYREYLQHAAVQQVMDDLLGELDSGKGDLWLVCYENTDDKRCHRTILQEVLRERAGRSD
ncbi:DUF488 family protein, N3 subclade [Halorussus ruber]|uniref:DUF488 family protein, N3 subclade n=1 Tax=Halorussus ruber TaxID=1126238 RepID=UPI00143D5BBB|nr:DUF488 family protein [Halorussus ruber]